MQSTDEVLVIYGYFAQKRGHFYGGVTAPFLRLDFFMQSVLLSALFVYYFQNIPVNVLKNNNVSLKTISF
ncbi:hypothetical protein DWQ65_06975 [Treponema phagedenis]|nr:hypothetical protein HMPREF9554_00784 [Treponema phagedenis F0421]QSH95419.1 hypothetical protein C5O78_10395 [Treponema phagedenis]QSH99809.1 hypothetical protein DWQ65_06975 [Treponema phagedenis]